MLNSIVLKFMLRILICLSELDGSEDLGVWNSVVGVCDERQGGMVEVWKIRIIVELYFHLLNYGM